jgi:hypothetical protein
LHRNPSLCRLLDIHAADQVPHDWNLSRVLDVLGREAHLTNLCAVFNHRARRGLPMLAGVRNPAALANLPEPERQAWQAFWQQVEGLLREGICP